jgi:hypothetical protein
MRRLLCGLLCGGVLLAFAGCSNSPKEPPPESQNAPMPTGPLQKMQGNPKPVMPIPPQP